MVNVLVILVWREHTNQNSCMSVTTQPGQTVTAKKEYLQEPSDQNKGNTSDLRYSYP